MPEIGVNLISQRSLPSDIGTYFTNRNIILLKDSKQLSTGEKIGNLYYLPVKVLKLPTKVLVTKNVNPKELNLILIHKRFGHINNKAISKLRRNSKGLPNLIVNKDDLIQVQNCEICYKANSIQHINKFTETLKATEYLEKTSSDLCGPMDPKTYNKFKYFIPAIINNPCSSS